MPASPATRSHRRRRSRAESLVERTRSNGRGRRSRYSRPSIAAAFGLRRQPDDRVDALGGRAEQRSHDPVEAGQRLGEPGSVSPAGVHRGECDRSATPPRPLAHQRHLGPFCPRVRARPVVVAARELEVVERQALRVHAARGDGDHARPRRLAEEGFEAMLERERTDNEERQGRFDAVGALGSRRMDRAGVVDQDVEPRLGRQDPIDRRRDRVERPDVGDDHAKTVGSVCRDERFSEVLESRRAAPDQDHPRSEIRDRPCRRQPEARGRPGHEDGSPCQGIGLGAGPREQTPAYRRPDAAEAADDRDLERRVDSRRQRVTDG